MNFIKLLERLQLIITILVLLVQIPFTYFVFTDKTYVVDNYQNNMINHITKQINKHYIRNLTLITDSSLCNETTITISNSIYCIHRYRTNNSLVISIDQYCPANYPYQAIQFDTFLSRYCFDQQYNTNTCNPPLPCYNAKNSSLPLQQINATNTILNYYLQDTFLQENIDCSKLQNIILYLSDIIQDQYKILQFVILIIWFVNLLFFFGMAACIFIFYIMKIKTNKYLTVGFIKFLTICTLLSESLMGMFGYFYRFKISGYTNSIRQYNMCFSKSDYSIFLQKFPYYYGKLMDQYLFGLLIISVLLIFLLVTMIAVEIFARYYSKQQWVEQESYQKYIQMRER